MEPIDTKRLVIGLSEAAWQIMPGGNLARYLLDIVRPTESIDARIARAQDSIRETVALVSELETTLRIRTSRLEELSKELERYSQLVQVKEGEARAVIQQFEELLGREKGTERWVGFVINIAASVFLAVVGYVIGIALGRPGT